MQSIGFLIGWDAHSPSRHSGHLVVVKPNHGLRHYPSNGDQLLLMVGSSDCGCNHSDKDWHHTLLVFVPWVLQGEGEGEGAGACVQRYDDFRIGTVGA